MPAMADLFEALAAPARRAILDELCDRDGQTLFELCGRLTMKHGLNMTRQAISQHLDALEAVGLVHSKRQGRYKFHYLDRAPLRQIVARWLTATSGPAEAAPAPNQPKDRKPRAARSHREPAPTSPFSTVVKDSSHEDRRHQRARR